MRRFDNFKRSRNEQDKLLSKICIYAFILLAALILFEKVIGNLPNIGSSITKATNYLNTLTAPFLMGFAIAYVMNPFLNFFEKIKKLESPKKPVKSSFFEVFPKNYLKN